MLEVDAVGVVVVVGQGVEPGERGVKERTVRGA